MPLFDYVCKGCGHHFEALVRGDAVPSCPECESQELDREIPIPRVKSESTHQLAMRAAKKRDAQGARDRMHERLQYEHSHDRHG